MLRFIILTLLLSSMANAGITEEQMNYIQSKCQAKVGNQVRVKTKVHTWKGIKKDDEATYPLFHKEEKVTRSVILKVEGSKQFSLDISTDITTNMTTREISYQDTDDQDFELLIRQYGELKNDVLMAKYGTSELVGYFSESDFTISSFGAIFAKIDVRGNKCDVTVRIESKEDQLTQSDLTTNLKEHYLNEVKTKALNDLNKDELMKLDLKKIRYCDQTSEQAVCEDDKDMSFLLNGLSS